MWPTRHVNFPYLAHEDYLYEVNFPHETCDWKKQNKKFSGSKMEILFPYIYIYIWQWKVWIPTTIVIFLFHFPYKDNAKSEEMGLENHSIAFYTVFTVNASPMSSKGLTFLHVWWRKKRYQALWLRHMKLMAFGEVICRMLCLLLLTFLKTKISRECVNLVIKRDNFYATTLMLNCG